MAIKEAMLSICNVQFYEFSWLCIVWSYVHCKSFSKTLCSGCFYNRDSISIHLSFHKTSKSTSKHSSSEERNACAAHGNPAISQSCPEQNVKLSPRSGPSVSKHLFPFCLLSQLLLIRQWKPFTFHILFNTLFFMSCSCATSTEAHSGCLSTMGGQSFALLFKVGPKRQPLSEGPG